MKKALLILAFGIPILLFGQRLERKVVSSGGTSTVSGTGVKVSQTTGETMVKSYSSGSVKVSEGFQQGCRNTAPTSITGSTTLCAGASTTLTCVGGSLSGSSTFQWFSGSCGGTMIGTGTSITVTPSTTTTYYVRAAGVCGTTTCASVTVTVPAALTVTPTNNGDVCAGTTQATLSANATNGTPPYSYLWSMGSHASTVSGIGAGTYSVTVTDANGCQATGTTTVGAFTVVPGTFTISR